MSSSTKIITKLRKTPSLTFIKSVYALGVILDAVWTIILLIPNLYKTILSEPDFVTDLKIQMVMGIAASLMAGWTLLLFWGYFKPIERRFVLLLTAFPVVTGLLIISSTSVFVDGNSNNWWMVAKTFSLGVIFLIAYISAGNIAKTETEKIL